MLAIFASLSVGSLPAPPLAAVENQPAAAAASTSVVSVRQEAPLFALYTTENCPVARSRPPMWSVIKSDTTMAWGSRGMQPLGLHAEASLGVLFVEAA